MLSALEWSRRLKRRVAPGLQWIAGGWRLHPDAGARRARLETARTLSEVLELAWPIATAMLGDTAMGLVDTQLVGRLGADALGGVGMGTTLMWLGYAFVFGLMRGVKVRVSHAVGEGRSRDAMQYAKAGVLLGLAIGVVVWALGRDAAWALQHLGIDPRLHAPAREFLSARTYGAPAVFVVSALVQYRQGLGDSRTPMMVGLVANVVNALLAYALIYGHAGLPALGVRGAGYATATTEALEAIALLALLFRDARGARREMRLSGRFPTVSRLRSRDAMRAVLAIGGPTGTQFLLETLAFTVFTALLGGVGAREVAAHQVAMAIIRVSFLPGLAVAEAASVLVGRALGSRRLDEADRVLRIAMALAVGFMTACGIGFAWFGAAVGHAFTPDREVEQVVVRLLHVAALFQTLDAVTTVFRCSLRGAKDVRAVMLIGAVVVWTCVPGAAWLLGTRAGLGAVGGWYGFVAETAVSAVLFSWRWRHGAWRSAYGFETTAASATHNAAALA